MPPDTLALKLIKINGINDNDYDKRKLLDHCIKIVLPSFFYI